MKKNAKKILWPVLLLAAVVGGWNFPAFGGSFGAAQGGAGAAQGGSGGGGGGGGGTDPWTRTGTTIAPTTAADFISVPGSGSASEKFGAGAAAGTNSTAVGHGSGDYSGGGFSGTTTLGNNSQINANNSIVIGNNSSDGGFSATVIGNGIAATAANQTMIGGTLTWPTGLGGSFVHEQGPPDVFLIAQGAASQGVTLSGGPSRTGGANPNIEIDDDLNDGNIYVFPGRNGTTNGSGSVFYISPWVGLTGNGLSDGYTDIVGALVPDSNGIAALGSTALGFSSLHLTSSAVASWNDDTGFARVTSSTLAAGNGANVANTTSCTIACAGLSVGITDLTAANAITLPAISGSYSNDNATGAQAWTLPTGAAEGTEIQVIVGAAQFAKLVAPANVVIYLGATPCVRGGFVRSNVPGSTATLKNLNPDVWVAVSVTGTWTEDQ